jgi:hypothetical protein
VKKIKHISTSWLKEQGREFYNISGVSPRTVTFFLAFFIVGGGFHDLFGLCWQ